MSIKLTSMVLEHFPGDPAAVLLAVCITDFANDDGSRIFPSVATLARKSRQSRRTVQRKLSLLRQCGWLLYAKKSNGGDNRSSEYFINPEWIKAPHIFPPNQALGGASE